MFESNKYLRLLAACSRLGILLLAASLFGEVGAAQERPVLQSEQQLQLPGLPRPPFRFTLPLLSGVETMQGSLSRIGSNSLMHHLGNPANAPGGVYRITLEEAQQIATGASNPALRIAELQVEAAKQHRLGVQADYFPKISGVFANLHLNKQTGQVLAVRHPASGQILSVPVNVVSKNQTMFNFSLVQPITPLFAIRQLVVIARADENIARAKAGMPVAEAASQVEKNYFDLLIAERELKGAEADSKKVRNEWLTAANSGSLRVSAEQDAEMIGAEKALAFASAKVKEQAASLNFLLGLPEETKLELVIPDPLVEDTSLEEVAQKAAAVSPEVVEAEQTAIKARAALKLAKMEYFPSVAIIGGYANQNILSATILPQDFSYIGFMATYNVFDFGKRERTVKERRAQVEAAELAVQLTKAKAAAGVKNSYFELERLRNASEIARRMLSAARFVNASYRSDDPDVEWAAAKMEADMLRAELEYRQAYSQLKSLMATSDRAR